MVAAGIQSDQKEAKEKNEICSRSKEDIKHKLKIQGKLPVTKAEESYSMPPEDINISHRSNPIDA